MQSQLLKAAKRGSDINSAGLTREPEAGERGS